MAHEKSLDWSTEESFNLIPSEDIFGIHRSLAMPKDEYRRSYKQAIDRKADAFLNEKVEHGLSDVDITNRDQRDSFLCSLLNNDPSDYETIAITIGCLFSAFYVSGEF
ncbi:MAG: hypothetical protein LUG50_13315 [Planctomycetaceae bacterium]|nr:hypothetical protein [Planctomycetaceae bacterium]